MELKTNEIDRYIERIKNEKAKITPQRVEILNIFLNNKDEHFTAEDIMKHLNSKTGQATVYRTLELFSNIGILKKVNFRGDEFTQYDLVDLDNEHFHHHLICDNCGNVIEIMDDEDLLASVEQEIQDKYNFRINNHELVLRGVCNGCQCPISGDSDDQQD